MTENQSPPEVATSAQTQSVPSARRRLVRGAFAAPAALTLLSGSAYAATSNAQCISAQVNGGSSSPPPINSPDTYLRCTVYKDPKGRHWVKGADVQAKRGPKTSVSCHLSSNQFQLCSTPYTITSTYDGNCRTSPPTPGSLGSPDPGKYALLRCDSKGNIVGVCDSVVTGGISSGVSASCWNSFINAA
jgi:hypothetical protein